MIRWAAVWWQWKYWNCRGKLNVSLSSWVAWLLLCLWKSSIGDDYGSGLMRPLLYTPLPWMPPLCLPLTKEDQSQTPHWCATPCWHTTPTVMPPPCVVHCGTSFNLEPHWMCLCSLLFFSAVAAGIMKHGPHLTLTLAPLWTITPGGVLTFHSCYVRSCSRKERTPPVLQAVFSLACDQLLKKLRLLSRTQFFPARQTEMANEDYIKTAVVCGLFVPKQDHTPWRNVFATVGSHCLPQVKQVVVLVQSAIERTIESIVCLGKTSKPSKKLFCLSQLEDALKGHWNDSCLVLHSSVLVVSYSGISMLWHKSLVHQTIHSVLSSCLSANVWLFSCWSNRGASIAKKCASW